MHMHIHTLLVHVLIVGILRPFYVIYRAIHIPLLSLNEAGATNDIRHMLQLHSDEVHNKDSPAKAFYDHCAQWHLQENNVMLTKQILVVTICSHATKLNRISPHCAVCNKHSCAILFHFLFAAKFKEKKTTQKCMHLFHLYGWCIFLYSRVSLCIVSQLHYSAYVYALI